MRNPTQHVGMADWQKRLEAQKKKQEEEKQRILNDPAPTEKFTMIYPTGINNKVIRILNGAGKLIGQFPPTPNLKKIFQGRLKIVVKAKIIDGQFELIKVMS